MLKYSDSFLSRALLLSTIALLPACKPFDWFKGEGCGCCAETEELKIEGIDPEILKEAIVTFDEKPVITGTDFERNFQALIETQPIIKEMLPSMPQEQQDQIFGQILDSFAMEKIMRRWVKESGTDQQAEFKKNARRAHELLDRDLALRAFENELSKNIVLTDAELSDYYQKQQATDPAFQRAPFATTPGGVKAQGFEAADEKEAKMLAAKVGDFATIAKDAKKKLVDFGPVNASSFIDPEVKARILSAQKFPSTEVVKGMDGKYRVVRIISKKEGVYAPFEKVKDHVKAMMMQKKFGEMFNKKIEELKETYKVKIDKSYIEKRKKKPAAEEPKPVEAAPAVAPAAEKPVAPEAKPEVKPEVKTA